MASTAEMMAQSVLAGDMVAARALADLLMNEYQDGAKEVLPNVRRLPLEPGRVRMIFFAPNDSVMAEEGAAKLDQDVRDWLSGARPNLYLFGFDRVEIYEIPEATNKP